MFLCADFSRDPFKERKVEYHQIVSFSQTVEYIATRKKTLYHAENAPRISRRITGCLF